ncbi:hypothetical protein [Alkalicoccobacillus plakortidis]|uniref:Lipoprotein n=1 Tax=Alkalicoccobacillus plakortidis TaxID=444060 RepID=A0ABT0XJ27_9BACI|nr:hypothetical protein [Alkalicoccobacillus plakortidis]MCM2675896.1 hypothetical protein [Alkalicoccobacillus plakortidis]
MKRMYLLTFSAFFIVGCSQEKSIEDIQEDYSIDLTIQDTDDVDPSTIAQLDQEQVEGLLNHIDVFKKYEGVNEFSIVEHSHSANQQIYRIELDMPISDPISGFELKRSVRFDTNDDSEQLEPLEISSSGHGDGGVDWVSDLDPLIETSSSEANLEILGEWQGEFIYSGDLIRFSVPNTWYINISADDLPRY